MTMRRPRRLNADFVRKVDQPGRYGDGRGGFGLSLLAQMSRRGLVKSWTQRVLQRNGRPTSIGLGGVEWVSLAEAREAAARNILAIKAGEDVLGDRQRRDPAMLTFQQAAERAIQSYAQGWKTDKTAMVWHQMLATYVYGEIGNIPIDKITSADVFRVLSPVWTARRATAIKVKTTINAVYAWAAANDLVQMNPVLVIGRALPKAGGDVTHRKALPWQEVPALLATIDASGAAEMTKLCVRFLALTATRSGESRGATWDEVSGSTWCIPAPRTKTGKRDHNVPLSAEALALLERARALTDGQGLIFPAKTGHALSVGALSKLFKEKRRRQCAARSTSLVPNVGGGESGRPAELRVRARTRRWFRCGAGISAFRPLLTSRGYDGKVGSGTRQLTRCYSRIDNVTGVHWMPSMKR